MKVLSKEAHKPPIGGGVTTTIEGVMPLPTVCDENIVDDDALPPGDT